MRYLQTEWQRNERDRIQWELERAEMKTKISRLEGEKRALQLQIENYLKKISLLETSLGAQGATDSYDEARIQYDKLVNSTSDDDLDLTPLINSRKYLEKCIQDVSLLLQSASTLYTEDSQNYQNAGAGMQLSNLNFNDGQGSVSVSPQGPGSSSNSISTGGSSGSQNFNGNTGMPLPPLPPPPTPRTKDKKPTGEETDHEESLQDSAKSFSSQYALTIPAFKLRHTVRQNDSIRTVDFIDQDRFLVANDGGNIQLFSTSSSTGGIVVAPRSIRRFKGHKGIICSVVHDYKYHRAFSAGQDHKIHVWDYNTGACLEDKVAHADIIWQLGYSESQNLLVSGSADGLVKIWKVLAGGKLAGELEIDLSVKDVGWILAFAFSDDENVLFVGCGSGYIFEIDISMGVIVAENKLDSGNDTATIKALRFNSSNTAAMIGFSDGTVSQYDIKSGSCMFSARKHTGPVTTISPSPCNESVCVSGGDDGTVVLWSTTGDGNESISLEKHSSPEGVLEVRWWGEGLLTTCGGDNNLRLYYSTS